MLQASVFNGQVHRLVQVPARVTSLEDYSYDQEQAAACEGPRQKVPKVAAACGTIIAQLWPSKQL